MGRTPLLLIGLLGLTLWQPVAPTWGQPTRSPDQLAQGDAQSIIPWINQTAEQISRLMALNGLAAGDVRVVDVSRQLDTQSARALDQAVRRNRQALADLRVALDNHDVVRGRLREHGLDIESVVGIHIRAPAALTVYARP